MEVLIVGRTKMGPRARCIGAIGGEGESLRLLPPNADSWSDSVGFQIGQIWNVEFTRPQVLEPPHVEDVIVSSARYLRSLDQLSTRLRGGLVPWAGGVDDLFDGVLGFTSSGNGYVARRLGVPSKSTWFWIPDRDLVLRSDQRHFDYMGRYKSFGLAYVGECPPPALLPAGTLVRVSLARWWRPDDVDIEERCYLQLSGWFE